MCGCIVYVLSRPLLFCCAALWSDLDGEEAETFVLVLIVIATVLLLALLSGFIVVKVTLPTQCDVLQCVVIFCDMM